MKTYTGESTSLPIYVPVSNIGLTQSGQSYNTGTYSLTSTVTPTYATNQTVTYSIVSNTAGATLSGSTLSLGTSGSVTVRCTVANGATKYTPKTQDHVITCFIPVTNISLSHSGGTYGTGSYTLSSTVTPTTATNKTVTYSIVSNSAGATLSGTTLTLSSSGSVTVRCTVAKGASATTAKTQDHVITCFIPVTSISLTQSGNTYTTSTYQTLSGTAYPTTATNRTVTYALNSHTGGGTLSGTSLRMTSDGSCVIRCTVANGASATTAKTQDHTVKFCHTDCHSSCHSSCYTCHSNCNYCHTNSSCHRDHVGNGCHYNFNNLCNYYTTETSTTQYTRTSCHTNTNCYITTCHSQTPMYDQAAASGYTSTLSLIENNVYEFVNNLVTDTDEMIQVAVQTAQLYQQTIPLVYKLITSGAIAFDEVASYVINTYKDTFTDTTEMDVHVAATTVLFDTISIAKQIFNHDPITYDLVVEINKV